MKEDFLFDLGPEQLNRLLLIGTEEEQDSVPKPRPGPGPAPASAPLASIVEQPGGWIGRYRLLSVLGEGGMGIVYLAEQAEPIKRRVALKVIKPGMDSKRVIARFEAERQALALLDHPNIAHVHDAGTTEAGRPYFVMEYVEGLPITDYCDRHKLTIEQRLRLFQQVCDAVQHAHQKGIIHRDLKPSNILVATKGEKAILKIIDFGVAKAIGHSLTEQTLSTEDSQLLGTPEYVSPEQADMATEDIDTRSDVYSLGVLLYVLLTGALPFDAKALRESGIEHIRKTIRETDPKTPSTRLTKLGDEAKAIAESRRTQVPALAKRLCRRVLEAEQRVVGEEHLYTLECMSELACVHVAQKHDQEAEDLLNKALEIARRRLREGHPLTLRFVNGLAVVHTRLKHCDEAETLLDEALKGRRRELGDDHPETLETISDLGVLRREQECYEEAESLLRQAMDGRQRKLGPDHPACFESMHALAVLYMALARYADAEPLLLDAFRGRETKLGPEHPHTVDSLKQLVNLYDSWPKPDEAAKWRAKLVK